MGLCCTKGDASKSITSSEESDYQKEFQRNNMFHHQTWRNFYTTSPFTKSIRSKEKSYSTSIIGGNNDMYVPFGFSQLYKLKELIGIGTTSKCYRCIHRTTEKEYACKVIDKRRLATDAKRRERIVEQLRREADVLQHLHHPNIVQLEDIIETKQYLFIVMELMRGGELFDAIIERGCFTESQTLRILQNILSALNYMHHKGIVHRDIKPENVLLESSSDTTSVKLIDFGFSRILNNSMTTSFLGTGGYLAPEIRQLKFYSTSVDMWAIGVLTYLLLSGTLPFQLNTDYLPASVTSSRVVDAYDLKFPVEQWSSCSSECVDFIEKLLQIDPIRRSTAQEALRHPWLRSSSSASRNTMVPLQPLRGVQSMLQLATSSDTNSLRSFSLPKQSHIIG